MKKLSNWMLSGVLASTLTFLPAFAQTKDDNKDNQKTDDSKLEPVPTYDKVKKGSLDDVNAIGNRDIGGRGLGDWYSLEKEVAMGKQYAAQVERSAKMVTDPVINEYVNRIEQNLVRHSDAKVPFTIKIIDDNQINAFALPGGFLYINSGTILAADDESELAGVMAHETAHVCARHAMRQITRANWANFATIPLIFVGGGIGYAAYEAAGIGIPLTFMKFSRGYEAQADYLGTQYLYASGYDPEGMVNFFEKIEATEKKQPGAMAKAFASHPPTPDRVEHTQEEIGRILPPKDEYVVTTSEFDQVKARLAAIENRRKVTDEKENDKPSLRRASNKTGDNGSGQSSGDDRPTLHRRDNPGNN